MFLNGVSTFATLETRQRQIGDLQTRLQRVSQELTTGRSQDVARTLGSATEVYESMVRSRDAAEALLQRNIVIGGRLDAGQAALSLIDGSIERLAEDVIAALGRDDQTALSAHLGAAQASLGESIAALNSHQGGRYLFSGTLVDQAPLAATGAFTQEIGTAVTGAVGITAQLAAVDALFDAGMPAVLYAGDDTVPEAEIALGDQVAVGTTANDPATRPLLQGLSMLAALDSGEVTLSEPDRSAYIEHAVAKLEVGQSGVTDVRTRLGFAQERVANADGANRATQAALELQINALVSVDPYDAASEFQALESQLQASYLVVSRMASLSLANYLR